MQRALILLFSLVILGLTALALDDVSTGRETNLAQEWLMVALASAWFGGWAFVRWRARSRSRGQIDGEGSRP